MHTMHETPPEIVPAVPAASHYHSVVWLDHHEARVVHFGRGGADEEVVRPADPPHHLHIKSGSASGTHVTTEPAFFRDAAAACGAAKAILLVGPSTAKTEFVSYLRKHAPDLADRIAEVEPLDKVTDHQLLAMGRRFLAGADRLEASRS